jgi:hypothetical protein
MTGRQLYEPVLSSREEIEYMLGELATYTDPESRIYVRGAVETLRWILGRQEASPVTGKRVRPVTCDLVRREGYESQVAMANLGRAPVGPLNLSYLNGVDDAAMWATGSSDGLLMHDDWPYSRQTPTAAP